MVDAIDFNYHRAMGLTMSCSKVGQAVFAHDYVIVDSGAPTPFNLGFPLRGAYKLGRTVAQIEAHFERRGLPYQLKVQRELEGEVEPELRALGYVPQDSRVPGMVLRDLEPTACAAAAPPIDGLRIERVEDADAMDAFADTAFEGFGLPVQSARAVLSARLFEEPALSAFVGYVDDAPACTSLTYVTGDVGGIYWVATREAHRGRGIGAAITARAVADVAARGCTLASLQASDLGRPVYARMGFEVDREYAGFRKPA